MQLFLTKKGDMPHWLVMLLYSLIGLAVILMIVFMMKVKMATLLANFFGS